MAMTSSASLAWRTKRCITPRTPAATASLSLAPVSDPSARLPSQPVFALGLVVVDKLDFKPARFLEESGPHLGEVASVRRFRRCHAGLDQRSVVGVHVQRREPQVPEVRFAVN